QEFKNYTAQNGLRQNRVFCYLNYEEQNLLGTSQGLMFLEQDTILSYLPQTIIDSVIVYNMFRDSQNRLWILTIRNGVYILKNKQILKHLSVTDGLLHTFVKTVQEDKDGNFWLGTVKGFNKVKRDWTVEVVHVVEGETVLTVNSAAKDKDGNIWFATSAGLYKYLPDGKFKKFTSKNGLPINYLLTITTDNESNLWMGTNGKGVCKFNYRGEKFFNYNSEIGLSNDIVNTIYEDSEGKYWFGSQGGIVRANLEENKFRTFTKNTNGIELGIATNTYDIIEDKKGNIWIGTIVDNVGMYRYDGNDFTEYNISNGLKNNKIVSFSEIGGNIWIGTYAGINVLNPLTNEITDTIQEISTVVWNIKQDKNNNLWLALENGAAFYDGNKIRYFNKDNGFVNDRVRSLAVDNKNNIWFATNNGLFVYSNNQFLNFTTKDGILSNTIYSIFYDKDNDNIWIGTQNGIQKIDANAFNRKFQLRTKSYGKEDGFIGVECNTNAVFKDSKNRLWYGTVKGATCFDLNKEVTLDSPPIVHITGVRYELEDINWLNYSDSLTPDFHLPVNLTLPYNINRLKFDYVGISYSAPAKVEYQYKLVPLDKDWLPLTKTHEAVYSHIPPGEYTFMVKAKNKDGIWSEPVTFSFTVNPPWYNTWWFYSIVVLVGASSVYGFTKYRTKQLEKQKKILEEQVALRTEELRAEKEKVEQKNKIIEEKNTEIIDSINYAKGIQESILPPVNKILKYLPKSFVLYRPKDIVSGDFYWMDVNEDGWIFFTAADCTGHGVPGAFVSLIGANGLNRAVNGFKLKTPAKVLDKLTELVEQTFAERKDGMDIALCSISPDYQTLMFAGANNPVWIVRKSDQPLIADGKEHKVSLEKEGVYLYEIKADKQPVGHFDYRQPFTNHEVELHSGDKIYVFSDGYVDQFGGPKDKKFMSKSFKKLLISIYDTSMEKQRDILDETIENWIQEGNTFQTDDICVFGVEV
ncbi:MAG: hypothetical protein D6707_12590, partial [Bacteroidetes bacterium]